MKTIEISETTLTIGNKKLKLTLDELRVLRNVINNALGEEVRIIQVPIPQPYPVYPSNPAPSLPYPSYPLCPSITCQG